MRIPRRELLKLGAWAVSTGLISSSAVRAAEGRREPAAIIPGKSQKILIIGAGLSGHVWHKHQWAKGAIALPAPRQMTSICIGAEKPEGRVHFAGEHLSHFSGWMQGALESGLRAAAELRAG